MIDPRGMTLRAWADAVILTAAGSWSFGKLEGDNWQDWATGFVRAPPYAQRVLPDPYDFTDWRDWAARAYPLMEVTD